MGVNRVNNVTNHPFGNGLYHHIPPIYHLFMVKLGMVYDIVLPTLNLDINQPPDRKAAGKFGLVPIRISARASRGSRVEKHCH